MFGQNRPRSTFEIDHSKPNFIFKSLFLTRNIVSPLPPGKYSWQELFKSTQALIFFWYPISKIWDWKPSPQQKRGDWYCEYNSQDFGKTLKSSCAKRYHSEDMQQKICKNLKLVLGGCTCSTVLANLLVNHSRCKFFISVPYVLDFFCCVWITKFLTTLIYIFNSWT